MTVADETDQSLTDRGQSEQDVSPTSDKHWLIFWGALLAASLPMMIVYLIEMWSFEHYRYIPFLFLVVGYLVWTRSDRVLRAPTGWQGWSLVIAGTLTILLSLALPSSWFGGVAFVLIAAAMIGSMSGTYERKILSATVPLLMLIRIPIGLDQRLINTLQGVTTDLSSVALDVIGVPHSISGNTVQLVGTQLFVAQQCSGIQSVFTLAFIACVIIAINRRRLWLTPLYLAISVFLAVAGNTIRVSTVAIAQHYFATDLSMGWQHDVLGYVTLGIATLFLLSFDQLIVTLLHPANAGSAETMDSPFIKVWNYLVADWQYNEDDGAYGGVRGNEASQTRPPGLLEKLVSNRTGLIAAVALFAVCGLGAAVRATQIEVNQAPRQLVGSYVIFNPKPELLQGEYEISVVGEHIVNRNGRQPRLGENADLWQVDIQNRYRGQLVVSQSYRGWHELCVCYRNMDWEQLDRSVTEPETGDTKPFVTARFRNATGDYGYLLFSAVNQDGTIPDPPSNFGTWTNRLKTRMERQNVITMKDLVMFQMWLVTPEKMRPETLKTMQSDFIQMRSRLATSVVDDAVDQSTTTSHRSHGED